MLRFEEPKVTKEKFYAAKNVDNIIISKLIKEKLILSI